MMDDAFSYREEGEFYSIQKHTFPRFKATFDYDTPLPKFISIEFSDDCDAKDIAEALSEMDAFMKTIHKKLKK